MLKRMFVRNSFNIKGNNREIIFNNDLTVVVGKNGSGKTTLLSILHAILTKSYEQLLLKFQFEEVELITKQGDIKNL